MKLFRDKRGQGMVEYAMIAALVSAVGFAAFQTLGAKTSSTVGSHPIVSIGGGEPPAPPAPPAPTAAPTDPAQPPAPTDPAQPPADPAQPPADPAQP